MVTRPGAGISAPRPAEPSDAAAVARVLPHPAAPLSLEEAGLPLDLVLQLALKTLHLSGDLTGTELGRRLDAISAGAAGKARAAGKKPRDLFVVDRQLGGVGKLYVAGGSCRVDAQGGDLNVLQVYDPAGDSWTAGPMLPRALADH